MSDFWSEQMQQQGIEISGPAPLIDATATWIAPLSGQHLLRLHGPDAEKFLQGQVTCDLNELSNQRSLQGANCSPKGNVISVFRLLHTAPHDLLLRVNRAIVDAALANLNKYIVFSKAELEDTGDTRTGVGIGGPNAESLLAKLFGDVPTTVDQQRVENDTVLVRVAGRQPRFELWLPSDQLANIWPTLSGGAQLVPSAYWQQQEIEAGLVQLDASSVDSYLPHMLNLQAVEGISFTKGCYTGQEVVARLHYRGKLKKVLYAAQVASTAASPGSNLHSPERRNVGKVLACIDRADGSQLLQAVINKSEADDKSLHLNEQDGPQIELLAQPYALDPSLFERS